MTTIDGALEVEEGRRMTEMDSAGEENDYYDTEDGSSEFDTEDESSDDES